MNKIYVALIYVVITVFCGCSNETDISDMGDIEGYVLDKTTREYLSNVNVSISPAGSQIVTGSVVTGGDGEFHFRNLKEGSYTLTITKENYKPESKLVIVRPDVPTRVEIPIERIPAVVTADCEVLEFGENVSSNTMSFSIVNPGYVDLDWEIEERCDWITEVKPAKGTLKYGKTEAIVVVIDRELLASGLNETVIVVRSSNGRSDVKVTAIGAEKKAPVLNVTGIRDIDRTTAVFSGEIVQPGIPSYFKRGFSYSLTSMDNNAVELLAEVNEETTFSFNVSGLTAGKTYYVRAFAINDYSGKVWSANELSFTTIESYPQVRTDEVTNLNLSSGTCILNGFIEHAGTPVYTERGFCLSDSGEPSIDNSKYAVAGNGVGAFTSTISGLSNEKTYRVRAYVVQNEKIFYGSTIVFSTTTTPTIVVTTAASSVTHNSAILNGSILKDGNPQYTERGFCYSTSNKTPTITDFRISVATTATVDFSHYLANLAHNKTFWFRAYAIQNGEPIYGEVASFETSWAETMVFTEQASDIEYYEMTLNGQINVAGIPNYTQKGFCYSSWYETPTLNNSTKIISSGTNEGPFQYHLAKLSPHTTYFYRAFAIQDGITIYGDVKSAKTYSPPQIITSSAYATPDPGMMNISWTVELSGAYGYKGDPECTDFGFVYGPGDHPDAENVYGYTTVQATKIEPFANSQGSFSVVLTQMVGYTKYYYCAYAKTSFGYIYGEVRAFSTQP